MRLNFILFILFSTCINGFINVNNNKLIDEYGRERIFHGVNVVYKGLPWHPRIDIFDPTDSFSIEDIINLKEWGFNVIRLGVMWPGVEPNEYSYNITYINILKEIVDMCKLHNIYVILDFHQDVLSEKFCGEGIPSWAIYSQNNTHRFPYPIDKNYKFINNIPTKEDCARHNWINYQFTLDASRAYQDLYDNNNGLKYKFINFWKIIAKHFQNCSNCIGYELMNEPWAGDIFKYPWLLIPKKADLYNLQPFYDDIIKEIRKIDNNHCILFESVTWDIYGVGFSYLPGNDPNKTILSYHAYFPPNLFIETSFEIRTKDIERLNCGGFLTEFSYGSGNTGDKKDLNKALELINIADKYLQSWAIWEYKEFFPITGVNKGFFNKDGSLTNTYYTISRPYAQAVNGKIITMKFNNVTKLFRLSYKPKFNNIPSEIYINTKLHYPYGYVIDVMPKDSIYYKLMDNDKKVYIYNKNNTCYNIININIHPKELNIGTYN